MLNNRNWIERAEYVSLIGSAIGAVVGLFSGNAIYATVPLFFALVFNTINRSRFEAVVRRNALGINRLHRQFKEEIDRAMHPSLSLGQQLVDGVRRQNANTPTGDNSRTLVEDNPQRNPQRNPQIATQIEKEFAELKQQYASLLSSLNDVINYLNGNALVARLERLESAIGEGKRDIKSPNLMITESPPTNSATTTPESNVTAAPEQTPQKKKTAPKNSPKNSFPSLPKFFGGEPTPIPQTWKCIRSLSAHADWVKSIAISPCSAQSSGQLVTQLVTGSFDSTVKLWDLETGELQQTLDYHDRGIFAVAISPDGTTLASTSWDKTIKLWELPNGDLIDTLIGHSGSVRSALFADDGRILITCSFDETIKLWDVRRGELIKTLTDYSSAVYSLALHPNGKTLIAGNGDGSISFWNLETGSEIAIRTGCLDVVEALIIAPNGRTLISGNGDGSIQVWQLSEAELFSDRPAKSVVFLKDTLSVHIGEVTGLAIAQSGETFASASADGTVKIWHLDSLELLCSLPASFGAVMSLAMSADGQGLVTLVTGMADGSVKIWQRE